MLLLALLAAAAPAPAPPAAVAQARAGVRIERPVSAGRDAWEKLPESARREVVVRDEQGRPVLLRLIEQQ